MNDDEKYEPNYDSALKLDIWTIKQAVSLMFNTQYSHISKNLDKLDYYEKWRGMLHVANTATGRTLEIETTETEKGGNTQYVKPIVFLKWAMSKGYSIPKILRPILHNMNIHNPSLDMLRDTDVWSDLEIKIINAMKEYPGWKKLEGKNKNGLGDLTSWAKEICNATVREAELIKDVLSEVYKISK